jgi:hypothetical protein
MHDERAPFRCLTSLSPCAKRSRLWGDARGACLDDLGAPRSPAGTSLCPGVARAISAGEGAVRFGLIAHPTCGRRRVTADPNVDGAGVGAPGLTGRHRGDTALVRAWSRRCTATRRNRDPSIRRAGRFPRPGVFDLRTRRRPPFEGPRWEGVERSGEGIEPSKRGAAAPLPVLKSAVCRDFTVCWAGFCSARCGWVGSDSLSSGHGWGHAIERARSPACFRSAAPSRSGHALLRARPLAPTPR